MDDLISRQAAIDALLHHGELENDYTDLYHDGYCDGIYDSCDVLEDLPSAQPEIIRCKDCKHNPKNEWFGCPMSHLSEAQRPETAWCWKAERRTDE